MRIYAFVSRSSHWVLEKYTHPSCLCSVRPGNEARSSKEATVIGQRLLFAIPPVGLHRVDGGGSKRVGRFSTAIIQITWRLDSLLSRANPAQFPLACRLAGWFTVDHWLFGWLAASLADWLGWEGCVVPSQIQVQLYGFHYKSTPTIGRATAILESPLNP